MLKTPPLLFALTLWVCVAHAEQPASHEAPQWYLQEIEFLTRDGGRWIASNANYQSEDEPFDAYGLVWEKGYAHSMTGRLFGVKDGKETGDFWRFRQYWHPGEQRVVLMQFGLGGAMGVGPVTRDADSTMIEQYFYSPGGGKTLTGHRSRNPDADTHITESFNIVDGDWRPDRNYTWTRAAN